MSKNRLIVKTRKTAKSKKGEKMNFETKARIFHLGACLTLTLLLLATVSGVEFRLWASTIAVAFGFGLSGIMAYANYMVLSGKVNPGSWQYFLVRYSRWNPAKDPPLGDLK